MRNKRIARLTLDAFIIALIAVMTFIPNIGYVSVSLIQFTTLHIIVLLMAILFGVREGAIAGFAFGFFCLIKAVVMPTSASDVFFINPLVSILPRLILGLLAGGAFDLIRLIKKRWLRISLTFVAMPILTIIHSVATLSMLWICYNSDPMLASYNYWLLISGIVSFNGLIETVMALVLVPLLGFGIYSGIKNMTFLPLKRGILTYEKKDRVQKSN